MFLLKSNFMSHLRKSDTFFFSFQPPFLVEMNPTEFEEIHESADGLFVFFLSHFFVFCKFNRLEKWIVFHSQAFDPPDDTTLCANHENILFATHKHSETTWPLLSKKEILKFLSSAFKALVRTKQRNVELMQTKKNQQQHQLWFRKTDMFEY